jgi:hypothetical protein
MHTFFRLLVLFLLPGIALAHGLDFGQLGLELRGERLTLVATPPVAALREFDTDGDARLAVAELQAQREAIAARLDEMLALRDEQGRAPELAFSDVIVPTLDKGAAPGPATHVRIIRKYRFATPPAGLLVATDLAAAGGRPLTVLMKADARPLQSTVLAADQHMLTFDFTPPTAWKTLRGWLPVGMEHILLGADHLLFLLLLLWGERRLANAALWLSAFTLGHSLTLGLVMLGIVAFPAWAEAAIAASIVAMGLARLYRQQRPAVAPGLWTETVVAAGFGLLHGMGFAGAVAGSVLLTEQRWPTLAGFNLGIELGQLLVVLLFWPALQLLRRHGPAWLARGLLGGATGMGVGWLLQRL